MKDHIQLYDLQQMELMSYEMAQASYLAVTMPHLSLSLSLTILMKLKPMKLKKLWIIK